MSTSVWLLIALVMLITVLTLILLSRWPNSSSGVLSLLGGEWRRIRIIVVVCVIILVLLTIAGIYLLHIDNLAVEQKFSSTYAEMRVDDDGRIRCEYKQTGVTICPRTALQCKTGWGTGTNLQNQPERAHNMFIADEGYEFNYLIYPKQRRVLLLTEQ